jgi:hypothetical protein
MSQSFSDINPNAGYVQLKNVPKEMSSIPIINTQAVTEEHHKNTPDY